MDLEKEKMSDLVSRLSEKVDELDQSKEDQDKFIRGIINMVENELDEDEKVTLYKHVFEELSFKRMVEQPDFMMRQSNIRLRGVFFFGLTALLLLVIAGLLFSSSPLITNLHSYLIGIFEIANN